MSQLRTYKDHMGRDWYFKKVDHNPARRFNEWVCPFCSSMNSVGKKMCGCKAHLVSRGHMKFAYRSSNPLGGLIDSGTKKELMAYVAKLIKAGEL